MKSVLISIRPQWCEKIASGNKTIEVRKSAPKEVPFKAYIYCTKGKSQSRCGKVIGEFTCNNITKITTLQHTYYNYIGVPIATVTEYGIWNDDFKQMQMTKKK